MKNRNVNLWIYNPNSFGGNFEYARKLQEQYSLNENWKCTLVLPKNANLSSQSKNILLMDVIKGSRFKKKLHFILRSLRNPRKFYTYLKDLEEGGLILFNDYDQLTAPIWVPWFKKLKNRFKFGAILHDPDRTNYPPSTKYSELCMKKFVSMLDFIMFHDHLPDLPYYRNYHGLKVSVPHGLYTLANPDAELYQKIDEWKNGAYTLGILGNIRKEKNYHMAISSLVDLPEVKLIIAGKPANSSVSMREYQALATDLGVDERIFWMDGYLTEEQMSAVINGTDLALLYYSQSFTSQSGILNLLASAKKHVLISRTESSLSKQAEKYGFGVLVAPDDPKALIKGIIVAKSRDYSAIEWDEYLQYADWGRHVDILHNTLNKLEQNETLAG